MIASILTTILVFIIVSLLLSGLVSIITEVGEMIGKLFTIEFFYMLATVISVVSLVLIGTALFETISLGYVWLSLIVAYIAVKAVTE